MRLPGVAADLALAVRQVNRAYRALPPEHQPELTDYDELEVEVDAACAAGDRERAMRAIKAWRDHWLAEFGAAA